MGYVDGLITKPELLQEYLRQLFLILVEHFGFKTEMWDHIVSCKKTFHQKVKVNHKLFFYPTNNILFLSRVFIILRQNSLSMSQIIMKIGWNKTVTWLNLGTESINPCFPMWL